MTKHPDNPYWCQHHDQPIAILSRSEWEEVKGQGYLTLEHVLNRLADILEYALGNGAATGIDQDGFLVALVADGHRLERGVTVRLATRDHPPPHVHVEVKGRPDLRLRLLIETGELLGAAEPPAGLGGHLRVARRFLSEHREQLMTRWAEIESAAPAHA